MRTLVIWMVLAASTRVDAAPPTLPIDVVANVKTYDWAIYQGDGPTRVLAMVDKANRVRWFRSDKGDYPGWALDAAAVEPYLRLTGATKATIADHKTAAATCKLGATFACTKVTFTDPKNKAAVTLLLSERVRATGIVEIEIKTGAAVMRVTLVGHGKSDKTEWGQAPTAKQLAWISGVVGVEDGLLGTIGHGGGTGSGPGVTPSGSRLGDVIAKGDLDKAIIRRYLRRQLAKLVYCYEKEQLAKPKLQGKVDVTFAIDKDGKVSSSSAKGLDKEIENCVARVIKAIEFPSPKNGSAVDVTFPMIYELPRPSPGRKI